MVLYTTLLSSSSGYISQGLSGDRVVLYTTQLSSTSGYISQGLSGSRVVLYIPLLVDRVMI